MTADSPRLRLGVLGIVAVSLFAALLARLWFLQVMTSPDYEALANTNSVKTVTVEAPRGRILDRNGQEIVGNRRSIVVSVDFLKYSKMNGADQQRLFNRLADELTRDQPFRPPVTADDLRKRMTNPKYSHFKPVPVAEEMSNNLWVYLEEHASAFPAVSVDRVEVRNYRYGTLMAHVLGYVGSITGDELHRYQNTTKPYANDSDIGKAGVERSFEDLLRGVPGEVKYEVNAQNQPVREISRTEPIQGYDVYLTIDINLQALAEKSLATELVVARQHPNDFGIPPAPAGSVVVLDPRSGAVLAMASNPTYDPNEFLTGISQQRLEELQAPERFSPFTNRSVQGLYSPGSTFKLVSTYAGLKTGLIAPDTTYNDTGRSTIPGCIQGSQCTFQDAGGKGVGLVDLAQAITRSSDAYYYKLGDDLWRRTGDLGPTPIQDAGARFGFGKKTGIQLPTEFFGGLPTPALRKLKHAEKPKQFPNSDWFSGDNLNVAIGQGEVQVSPLQLANAYATFANAKPTPLGVVGTEWQTTLLSKVNDAGSAHTVATYQPKVLGTVAFQPGWHETMLRGFEGVTTDDGGTAAGTFVGFPQDLMRVAGKTGTAQIGKDPKTGADRQDTSLFVGFGPSTDAQYVVTAVMEQSGFGADVAAPVVRDVLEPIARHQVPIAPPGGYLLDGNGQPVIPPPPPASPPPPPTDAPAAPAEATAPVVTTPADTTPAATAADTSGAP